MILPVYTYGEKILEKPSEIVDLNDPTLPELISNMFDTMRNANGIGLAAPQIGINKRIIVVETKFLSSSNEEILFKEVFINPKIISYSDYKITTIEGCLSFPELQLSINRPLFIDVEWYNENKVYQCKLLSGLVSIILQHEIDHLNGVLFIDKISQEEKNKFLHDLKKIKQKKVKSKYLII